MRSDRGGGGGGLTPPDQTDRPLRPDTSQTRHPPPCEQTDARENITFPASLRYAVSKD